MEDLDSKSASYTIGHCYLGHIIGALRDGQDHRIIAYNRALEITERSNLKASRVHDEAFFGVGAHSQDRLKVA